MNIKEEINSLKQNTDKKFNLSIIFVTLILFVYCYFGSYSFFEKTFDVKDINYWKIIYHNMMPFLLFFVLGLIYTKVVLKSSPKDFGFKRGNWKFGLTVMGLATLIVPLLALSTVLDKDMSTTYPLVDFKTYSAWWQIALYFLSYIMYYIGWEYLFRGIALFGTKDKLGTLGAILLTTLISSLIHTSIASFGKPMIETLSAIPAGLIFGYITNKSESQFYSLYTHALVGILTDIFIFLIV